MIVPLRDDTPQSELTIWHIIAKGTFDVEVLASHTVGTGGRLESVQKYCHGQAFNPYEVPAPSQADLDGADFPASQVPVHREDDKIETDDEDYGAGWTDGDFEGWP